MSYYETLTDDELIKVHQNVIAQEAVLSERRRAITEILRRRLDIKHKNERSTNGESCSGGCSAAKEGLQADG